MIRSAMIAVVVSMSVAYAEPPEDHGRAVELFEEGRRLMTNQDPAGACAKFLESIRLEPFAAGTMLNLGLCHQLLGRYKSALYWFRKAQIRATETQPRLPAVEEEAREHTIYLATVVATIRIEVPAAVPELHVAIDDEPVRPEDYAHLEVDPGPHAIVATATGKPMFRKQLDIAGRGGETVVVTFGDTSATPREPTGQPSRTWLYLAIGGGALLSSSLALTLYEKHVYNEHETAAMHGDAAALAETQHATKIARFAGTGLAVAGLAAIGVAGYLFFTAPEEPAVIAPVVTPDHVGAMARWRF